MNNKLTTTGEDRTRSSVDPTILLVEEESTDEKEFFGGVLLTYSLKSKLNCS